MLPPKNPYRDMSPELLESIKTMKSKIPYTGKSLDEAITELQTWKGIENQADIVVDFTVHVDMHKD